MCKHREVDVHYFMYLILCSVLLLLSIDLPLLVPNLNVLSHTVLDSAASALFFNHSIPAFHIHICSWNLRQRLTSLLHCGGSYLCSCFVSNFSCIQKWVERWFCMGSVHHFELKSFLSSSDTRPSSLHSLGVSFSSSHHPHLLFSIRFCAQPTHLLKPVSGWTHLLAPLPC